MRIFALLLMLACAAPADARVFDIKKESFAMYFGGTFGSSNLGDGMYAWAASNDVTYDKKVLSTTSGEFGALIVMSRVNIRIGGEYLMPREQVGVVGTDAAGTTLFTLTSKVSALVPMINMEFKLYQGQSSRAYLGVGYGIALASISNEYVMTAAGTSKYTNITDYKETGTGSAPLSQAFAGFEFHFADTTTAAFQIGYRYCQIQNFKSSQAVNAIGGAQTDGGDIKNFDGSRRAIDLSGAFVGLNFRFFL